MMINDDDDNDNLWWCYQGKWISFIFAVEDWMLCCAGADGANAQLQSIWKHVLGGKKCLFGFLLG